MERKRAFILYLDYAEHLRLLSVEECGKLLLALFEYEETGTLPAFSGALAMAFSFIRLQLDRDKEAYKDKCKKNAENGAKGGRPPKDSNPFEK